MGTSIGGNGEGISLRSDLRLASLVVISSSDNHSLDKGGIAEVGVSGSMAYSVPDWEMSVSHRKVSRLGISISETPLTV